MGVKSERMTAVRCYTDGRINSSNVQAISDRNFVGFWSVSPEFTRINCVQ